MSDISDVIFYYNEAKEALSNKKYEEAALSFYKCWWKYENGELPIFDSTVQTYGEDAIEQYKFIVSKYKLEKKFPNIDEDEFYGK